MTDFERAVAWHHRLWGDVETLQPHDTEPESEETYGGGVRKATYRDPDGTGIGIGGGPVDTA